MKQHRQMVQSTQAVRAGAMNGLCVQGRSKSSLVLWGGPSRRTAQCIDLEASSWFPVCSGESPGSPAYGSGCYCFPLCPCHYKANGYLCWPYSICCSSTEQLRGSGGQHAARPSRPVRLKHGSCCGDEEGLTGDVSRLFFLYHWHP